MQSSTLSTSCGRLWRHCGASSLWRWTERIQKGGRCDSNRREKDGACARMLDANLIVDRCVCRAESHIVAVDVGHKLSFTYDNTDTEHRASVRVAEMFRR